MSVRRAFGIIPAAALLALGAAVPAARAQSPAPGPDVPPPYGQTVVNVALRVTGYPDYSQTLLTLIDVKPQQPLTREAWRRSVDLLMKIGRFDAMRLDTRPVSGGVAVTFAAEPRHPVTKLLLLGTAGLQGAVEHRVLDAFGGMPANVAPELVKVAVIEAMSDEGYRHATATVEEATFENPDRKTLTFAITPGPLAVIGAVKVENSNIDALPPGRVERETGATPGAPFREGEIRDGLQKLVDGVKAKGYYTATAPKPEAVETPDGTFDVTITIDPGPLVVLQWEKNGQELSGDLNTYVPARQQNRIDDDLLNDATTRMQNLLRNQGYLDATAPWTVKLTEDKRVYTYHVTRGPKYFVDRVEIPSGLRLSPEQISALLKIRHGDVLDGARLNPGLAAVTAEYQKLNFYAAQVGFTLDPAPKQPSTPRVAWRVLRLNVVEGAQGKEVKLVFERATTEVPEDDLRSVIYGIQGSPFLVSNNVVVAALKTLYDARGYRNASIQIVNSLSADHTTLTRRIQIDEHKRLTVLDVTVVGQHDVSERQIRELLVLHAGDAFSSGAQAETQRKIADMGVFRQVTVQPLDPPGPDDTGVHLIVRVVEAPDTTISYGADLEGGKKPRTAIIDSTGTVGTVSRLEFAPRGSFGIERRNLGGRNRVLSFYSRVSLRPKDAPEDPLRDGKGYSLSEYRGVLQYRERRLFRTHTDLIFGISGEQAIRTTFNFRRQDVSLELQRALKPKLFATFRYTLDFTQLYDQRFQQFDDKGNITDLKLQVDRAFSQVRLSTLSFSLLSDHRDDTVAPSRGSLIGGDTELALRGIGSEVGYTKTFLQAAFYRRVTSSKRVVAAGRAQLGVARGFVRPDPTSTTGGTIEQIPASQRFFAGGSTTVRGFQLDALGVPGILIDPNLSLGGNGLVIFNAEVRTTLGKLFHRDFGVVQFVDAGNVFAKAGDISLADLRASVGFGFRYASPVGPLRLDFGFKTARHTVNNILESRWEFHLSFGQAF